MSMNWSDLIGSAEEGGGFDVVPAGDYLAKVVEASALDATTGKPMVKAKFQIIEGAFATRLVWNNFVLTKDNPNALKWFFRHMAAFGLDRSFFALNPSMAQVAANIQDKIVIITLKSDRLYQGIPQNDVTAVRPAPNVPGRPVSTPTPSAPNPSEPGVGGNGETSTDPQPTTSAPKAPF